MSHRTCRKLSVSVKFYVRLFSARLDFVFTLSVSVKFYFRLFSARLDFVFTCRLFVCSILFASGFLGFLQDSISNTEGNGLRMDRQLNR